MGSIPGPIIQFRISQPELNAAVQPAFAQVRQQSQSLTNGIAEDWKRMAAQIRASVAQGLSADKETVALRTQIIGMLDRQIAGYRALNELSQKELSNLKAATLERERQADALKRSVGVGVTGGTSSALGQVSAQTVLGIERVLDSVVNRYLGGAAGAAFRTVRDVSYYSNQASGGTGGGSLAGGLSSVLASVSPATLAVGGLVTGLVSTGAILASVTHSMTSYAQSVQNVAAATGLSYSETQRFRELAKITGVDADGLTQSFGRLQSELGKFIVSGKDSEGTTQNFVKVLDKFNISVTDSGGKLRPIGQIMSDFAAALAQIPDTETRTAVGMDAMGIRGKILVQVIDNLRASGLTLKQALDEVNKASLSDDTIKGLLREKRSWDDLIVSIDAAKLHVEAFIATHKAEVGFAGIPGVAPALGALGAIYRGTSYLYDPGAPGSTGVPTAASAQGLIEEYASRNNQLLLTRAEILKAGGQAEYQLLQAEQKYAEAVKASNGADAEKYADQIASLKAVIELQKQSAEEHKRFTEFLLNPGTGSLTAGRERNSLQALIGGLLNPGQGGAPDIGIGISTSTNYLTGILGPAAKAPLNGADILQQINKEHEDLFKSQAAIDAEHYQDELDTLNDALKKQLISYQEYSDAVKKLTQDRNKTLSDAAKKYDDEAGKLFDDLLAGHTKDFTKALLKDVEEIATGPVKKSFESLIGSQLQSLADIFSGKAPAGGAGTGGTGGGALSSVWGALKGIWSGKTPGFVPGSTGSVGGLGGAASAGQANVGTMDVRAGVVNIYSLGVASAGGAGGIGNFFGANSLLGGTGNFFGNLNPFGGSSSSGTSPLGGLPGAATGLSSLSKVINAVNPYLAGAATLGIGLATGNESAMAIGAASLAGKAANALSGISGLPSGLSSALGQFASAAPGFGIAAGGIIAADQSNTVAGKLGGTLEAGAGGALAGLAIGGPIGAAIGGAVGLIGGAIASIFGGGPQGFAASVKHAMTYNQYHAPLSENFSFASNGSIANTLGTGFFQSGSQFSQYALPANTPFYASALTGHLTWQQLYQLQNSGLNPNAPFLGNPNTNPYVGQGPVGVHAGTPPPTVNVTMNLPGYIDAQSAATALTPHAATIAQLVTKQLSNSSSGFASSARRAVWMP